MTKYFDPNSGKTCEADSAAEASGKLSSKKAKGKDTKDGEDGVSSRKNTSTSSTHKR